jgi:hypothetical protein
MSTDLRTLLVAHAAQTASRTHRTARIGAVAASVAVVGAVAAVAIVAISPPPGFADFLTGAEPYEMEQPSFIRHDDEVLGTPTVVAADHDITLPLAAPPAGATDLAIEVRCLERGTYTVTLDGEAAGGTSCSADDSTGGSGAGGYVPFDPDGPNVLMVTVVSPEGRFAIWAGWVARAPDPEPSAETVAALADGVVTREEYVASFERYRDCMADAGMPLEGTNTQGEIIQYTNSGESVDSGVEHQCYQREFAELDMQWQVEHPQMSLEQQAAFADLEITRDEYLAGFDRFAACLAGIGASVSGVDRNAEVLDYTVEAGPELSGEAGRCYRFEFFNLDMSWRQSHGG